MSEQATEFLNKEEVKTLSILAVAQSLGMEMKRASSQEYYWSEHDSFKINVRKNNFNWYSRGIGGDVIQLVQTVKEVTFKEALAFLRMGEFPEVKIIDEPRAAFQYSLADSETPLIEGRQYLREQRGLSDETIDFFLSKGVLAQADRRTGDGYEEPVLVFKFLDQDRQILGGSLQGIRPNKDRYEGKGYLKQILYNSDGLLGMHVDIGQPNRLVFAEAPIDLMSYYELHKDDLTDVRLVSMDGLKLDVMSRHVMELYAEMNGQTDYRADPSKIGGLLEIVANHTTVLQDPKYTSMITMAIDNDTAGRNFLQRLEGKNIPYQNALPEAVVGEEKMDWNAVLVMEKANKNEANQTTKKAPDIALEPGNAGEFHRTSDFLGDESPRTASQPVAVFPQPDFPAITPLKFTTKGVDVSTRKPGYRVATDRDLRQLNLFAPSLQDTSQWYLKELAASNITYVFQTKEGQQETVTVGFEAKNFAHLAGIAPVGVSMSEAVHQWARGQGDYDNILVSNGLKDKVMVLPYLKELVHSSSFVFNDLSEVEKLHKIDLSKALTTEDEELLLALRDTEEILIPASVMRIKGQLATDLADKKAAILGVYRDRDGQLEQLSVNEVYIKDGGREMMSLLQRELYAAERKRMEGYQREETKDSDFDGLSDQYEGSIGTSARSPDRDGDGLSDYEEAQSQLDQEASSTIDVTTVSALIAANDLKGLNAHLKEGMKQYLSSEAYRDYLTAMSKLNNYSPRNVALILAQNPNATQVASYQSWQKNFNRQVQKGEKAIKVWAPMTVNLKDARGQPLVDEKGEEKTMLRFKTVSVFDVSQTAGDPVPKMIYNLTDDVKDYRDLVNSLKLLIEEQGLRLFRGDTGQANGYFDPSTRTIVISDKELSQLQMIKTILHELAHAELHQNGSTQRQSSAYATQELQAESVAYIVSSHLGVDTSTYTFPYLVGWSRDDVGMKVFEEHLAIVQKEASSLIQRIDQKMEQIRGKNLVTDKFTQRLDDFKQQQALKVTDKSSEVTQEKKSQEQSQRI